MQNHWYELGSLLLQLAFLAAVVWFARKLLKTFRASQEQVGALLRLSVSDAIAERPRSSLVEERTPKPEAPALSLREHTESGPGRVAAAGRHIILWLQTPMGSRGVAPWRRVIRWLQAPAGS